MPLHVGKAGKPDIRFRGDDSGDHISGRNGTFCELTGLYWAWKNLQAEYVGFVHYRRNFTRWEAHKVAEKRRAVFKAKVLGKVVYSPLVWNWQWLFIIT